jgi:NADH:ubiquinone oxidoreductase subunit 2 (subunit N)
MLAAFPNFQGSVGNPGRRMDQGLMILLGIMAAIVVACVAMFVGYLRAMRRAGSETRRRLIARAAIVNWTTLAILTQAILLAALGVLPHWVPGVCLAAGCIVSVLATRHARRSTLRSHSLA